MKVAFITTLRHNVGDDFVREGLIHLLKESLTDSSLEIECIHKHAPVSSRYSFEWVRRKELSSVLDLLPIGLTRDRILECDLLIQSGAPVYWCHHGGHKCSQNEWHRPLILKRYARIRDRVPFLNLAAGSCQPYHSSGREFHEYPQVIEYIRDLHGYACVTTVRDSLAKTLLDSLGLTASLIPCASIFARDSLRVEPGREEYVALNFMPLGGHYDLRQSIRHKRWRDTFHRFYTHAIKRSRCVFVCHDKRELRAAREMDPKAETFYSEHYRDYVEIYSKAKTGIANRVHAALMIASFGRPAFVVGNDSRTRMAEEIGLRHTFVDDATCEELIAELERNLNGDSGYGIRFDLIKANAYQAYRRALRKLELRSVPVKRAVAD